MAPPKTNLLRVLLMHYINFNCSKINERNYRLNFDDFSDWPLPNKIPGYATETWNENI